MKQIPEEEGDEEEECYETNEFGRIDTEKPVVYTIRKLVQMAVEKGLPRKIITEND